MINNIFQIIMVTFLPFLELRASIPYGILILKENWILVFFICVITNIILGMVLFPLINTIIAILTKVKFIKKIYNYYVVKTQKKITKYVDKYGEIGIALFIGIPLPGSGVYSGSLGANLIGLKYKKFIIANILGVLIAGIIVTIIVLSGNNAFSYFIKTI
jgi:uncharacterized membrane protein